jgi:site-specific DNA-methyltransferase (adenine-specific)
MFTAGREWEGQNYGDSGGASRFFYVAKASKKDRNEGLEELEGKEIGAKGNGLARACATCSASVLDGCDCPDRTFVNPTRANFHPTVKPIALMEYLIKLVTPEGGVVLDPFTGSGSTGKAALLNGYQFIGIELTDEYLPIIEGRLRWANEQASKKEEEKKEVLF